MQGYLLVDKPAGWTSFDVVNFIRRMVANHEAVKPKSIKVGHCGTLDPFATGLLVILIGKAYTRQAERLTKLDKTYEIAARLGEVSTTGDPEGQIQKQSTMVPDKPRLILALTELTGEIQQTPPIYSAIKIDGKRAYQLAREGMEVKMQPRSVHIHSLELIDYAYPEVRLTSLVSSGTYIRSLIESLGEILGTGAYTFALKRTTVGDYSLNDAIPIENLDATQIEKHLMSFA